VIHNTCEDSLLAVPLIIDLVILAELFERIQVLFIVIASLKVGLSYDLFYCLIEHGNRFNAKGRVISSHCIPCCQFYHIF
jgi:hypothetical protein